MTTATVFNFADRNGDVYRTEYKRNAGGFHSWEVWHQGGRKASGTDFTNEERELSPDEIEQGARSWTRSLAANRGPSEAAWSTARDRDRELEPEEVARFAEGVAAKVALDRGGLDLDANGYPVGWITPVAPPSPKSSACSP